MIHIGLTTWSEHQSLVQNDKKVTLGQYADFFDIVEVDTFYYGIHNSSVVEKWLSQVSPDFQFLIKGHREMTVASEDQLPEEELRQLFDNFKEAILPIQNTNQLRSILLQFPPNFILTPDNMSYLVKATSWLKPFQVAIEFRQKSWYQPKVKKQVIQLLQDIHATLVIPDEAQTPNNSVPFDPIITNSKATILRLHGRNYEGWLGGGKQPGGWRSTRTLYKYSEDELQFFSQTIRQLAEKVADVTIIFNNNSGGDAADNARRLQTILGLEPPGDPTEQLSLF